jgi:hypothetical protein
VPYSRFCGEPASTETRFEYSRKGRLIRSVAVSEPDWSDLDRGLVLALLEERAETCSMCGHPMSECRDPRTAQKWLVDEQICQPSRIAQAASENAQERKARGVVIMTRRGAS